jgi:hypothetical protein
MNGKQIFRVFPPDLPKLRGGCNREVESLFMTQPMIVIFFFREDDRICKIL